jgi:endonuclease VIII
VRGVRCPATVRDDGRVPEGDTVWLAGRRLHQALAGQRLARSDFRVPRHATADLADRTVLGVLSRGKHLLTRFSGDTTLHTHLRMDGSWHLYRPGRPWTGGPAWQVRVVLSTASWVAVGYRLPVVDLLPTSRESDLVGHLGPDLLGPDWDPDEAERRLLSDPDRPVGEALLDQRIMAGLGNLYRTELCFLLGITPWVRVGDLADPAATVQLAHRLLDANKETSDQVTTGDRRRGHRHWVFEQRRCQRCGTPVATGRQGAPPRERLTAWCPRCQTGPTPGPRL